MKSHWTARYVFDRAREWVFHRTHPRAPWLGPAAVRTLGGLLKSHFVGLEAGAGRSTPWIARRVAWLTSLEEDEEWMARVNIMLREARLRNVALRYVDKSAGSLRRAYLAEITSIEDSSLDFATVDSEHERASIALALMPKLKPSGFLMLDNANWFLPSSSRAPGSRRGNDGSLNSEWELFRTATSDWNRLWTSSGVTDTAFFFKPAA